MGALSRGHISTTNSSHTKQARLTVSTNLMKSRIVDEDVDLKHERVMTIISFIVMAEVHNVYERGLMMFTVNNCHTRHSRIMMILLRE